MINNAWVSYNNNIQPMKNNKSKRNSTLNPDNRSGCYDHKYSLDSHDGELGHYSEMLTTLLSSTKSTTKVTSQPRDTNRRNGERQQKWTLL